jgi:hypothetical protein
VSAWERLVRAALLGTERQAAPEDTAGDPALDAAVAALSDRPAEARLLGTAALLDAWRRAGRRAGRTDAPAPPPAPQAEERVCGPHTAAMLRQVLAGGPQTLVAEWMALASGAGAAIPHELLPPVLDYGARHAAVRADVARALGARGRWLASLNPAWAYAIGPTTEAAAADGWESGTGEERVRILRVVRQSDPAAGLALVRSTWATDASRDRAAFVDALSAGLGMDDEPFLESALDDKRKEVRVAAARLLGTLPGSRLVGRMTERLASLLRLHVPDGIVARMRGQDPRIFVGLPAACDKAMQRDGIEPKPPYGTGERTWWLHQMIAGVPPSVWSAAWGMDATACIAAARAGGEPGTLVRAWTQAAIRAGDAAWAEALLRAGADTSEHLSAQDLLAAVPPHRLEAVALERLGQVKQLHGGSTVSRILESARVPWSPALTRAVLLALAPALDLTDYSLREMLRVAANYVHPATAVATLREQSDPHEGAWVDLIHLRHTLHQAFR